MKKITKVGNQLNLEHGIKVIQLELKNIPKKPGIYKMINSSDEPIYIGKAKNLRKRISSYSSDNKQTRRIKTLISLTRKLEFIKTPTEIDSLILTVNIKFNEA